MPKFPTIGDSAQVEPPFSFYLVMFCLNSSSHAVAQFQQRRHHVQAADALCSGSEVELDCPRINILRRQNPVITPVDLESDTLFSFVGWLPTPPRSMDEISRTVVDYQRGAGVRRMAFI